MFHRLHIQRSKFAEVAPPGEPTRKAATLLRVGVVSTAASSRGTPEGEHTMPDGTTMPGHHHGDSASDQPDEEWARFSS